MSDQNIRPRRLRKSMELRNMLAQTDLQAKHLIAPLFVKEGLSKKVAISSMPGVYQYALNDVAQAALDLQKLGILSVIVFGIPQKKDAKGSQAYAANGIIQQAIRKIKKACPKLIVISDVCLCEYTSHGHCGVLNSKAATVENDPTLSLLAKTAVSQAKAGADIVAPSDMMDHRVQVIREALDQNGFSDVAIMSYAVKYASAFYGPFRDAAENSPSAGDRKSYQMDFRNVKEACKEAMLDETEGADFLIVKPASLYLDIIHQVSQQSFLPVVAYNVSGEYSMIKSAAKQGYINEKDVVYESLIAMRRAGAQLIITYFAYDVAKWLQKTLTV